MKVLEHIQLMTSTATLRGFGHVYDSAFGTSLPPKHSDKEGLNLSDLNDVKKLKAIQANDNAMAWLRMAFPLPKHQHEIDASGTNEYPLGVSYEAVR